MQIGRKIYYDKITGNIIVDTGDREGSVVETTIEWDYQAYTALAERTPETVGMIQLKYGQYWQDFMECNGYRINLDTLQIEFSYPDPNNPAQEPIYQKPLSEEVEGIKSSVADLEMAMASILGGAV